MQTTHAPATNTPLVSTPSFTYRLSITIILIYNLTSSILINLLIVIPHWCPHYLNPTSIIKSFIPLEKVLVYIKLLFFLFQSCWPNISNFYYSLYLSFSMLSKWFLMPIFTLASLMVIFTRPIIVPQLLVPFFIVTHVITSQWCEP